MLDTLGSDGNTVKIDKLIKKLQRELAASPQKAGALVLLALVAVYFWGPPVMKWSGNRKSAPQAASSAPGPTSTAAVPTAASPATLPLLGWQQVQTLLDQDRHTRPAIRLPHWQDPFAKVEVAFAKVETPVLPEAPVEEPQETPEASGPREYSLTLSSVLVGKRAKSATLNGKVYHEGDEIEAEVLGSEEIVSLTVKQIHKEGVTLTANDNHEEVALSIRKKSQTSQAIRQSKN